MLRTKVVCTLGPSTADPDTVLAMVQGGMNLARINMSHGSRADHRMAIEAVRAACEEVGRPVAVLVDLAGPKIRVGELAEPIEIERGSEVVFAPEETAEPGEIPTTYAPLAEEIQPNDYVLVDDGLLELRCTGTQGDRTHLEVIRGGLLKSRKGINLPTVNVKAPSLTEKDLDDLEFALQMGVEYVGLSFVRRPEDVVDLKGRVGNRALVVAKVEKVEAVQAIEEVLAETDAVMVARGDLGVELPFERVPLAQKRIIQLANYYSRPVITATQMLESMIEHPRPTRAEASDVANAILDGSDAVMLSGETAVGEYPLEALGAIVRIATEIERSGFLERGPRYLTGDRGFGTKNRRTCDRRHHALWILGTSGFLLPAGRPGLCGHDRTADLPSAGGGMGRAPGARDGRPGDVRRTLGIRSTCRGRVGRRRGRGIGRDHRGLPVPRVGLDQQHAPRPPVGAAMRHGLLRCA
jgi:pyruvate kinase